MRAALFELAITLHSRCSRRRGSGRTTTMTMNKWPFQVKYSTKINRSIAADVSVHAALRCSAFLCFTSYRYWNTFELRNFFFFVGLELDAGELPPQMSVTDWPELRRIFTERFASKTQADWSAIFDGTDACVTPVLSFDQVSSHPHNQERASFIKDSSGEESPRPAPVLSLTPAKPCLASDPVIGEHTVEVLEEYGFTSAEVDQMLTAGVVESDAVKAKL